MAFHLGASTWQAAMYDLPSIIDPRSIMQEGAQMPDQVLVRTSELQDHLERAWAGDLKRSWNAIFLARLDDALHAPEAELRGVASGLAGTFQAWIAQADERVREVALGTTKRAPDAASKAFLLGQLAVAQGLAARTVRSRADHQMIAALSRYLKYLLPLSTRELSNKELAQIVGESTEHVTRQLGEMRRSGLVDFRKESKNTINFLTKATQALLPKEQTKVESNEIAPTVSLSQILARKRISGTSGNIETTANAARINASGHYKKPAPPRQSPQRRLMRDLTGKLAPQYRSAPIFGQPKNQGAPNA